MVVVLFISSGAKEGGDIQFLESLSNTTGLFFLGHIYNIDIPKKTVSISWLIGGCGAYRFTRMNPYPSMNCGPPNMPVEVYVDGSPRFSYDPAAHPWVYAGNNEPNSTLYIEALNEFQTTHLLEINTQKLILGKWNHYFDQEYYYPFENFRFETNVVAMHPDNSSTSFNITKLGFSDLPKSFEPIYNPVRSRVSVNGTMVDSYYSQVNLYRANSVIFFTGVLFLVNWALTIMVVYIAVGAFVSGRKVGEGILVLPVTVILTIPALRALFVENPPFGILIDVLGIFMQMIIVAICSLVLLGGVVSKSFGKIEQFTM